jgi:hypothetical protein
MREDNRYPPEPETDPGEEETKSYQMIAARPMHMMAHAASKVKKIIIIINNNSALPISGCNAGSQAACCSLQPVALSEYVKKMVLLCGIGK